MKWLAALAMLIGSPAFASAHGDELASPEPVQVMLIGTYHWANPGLDVVNMQVDDVLSQRRQREIQNLAQILASWNPIRIAVEKETQPPALTVADYGAVDALLRDERNESIQLGYRIADMLGHEAVYGIDERGGEGEPDYFPFASVQSMAATTGQTAMLAGLFAEVETLTSSQAEALQEQSIAESLLAHNDAQAVDAMHDRLYYSLLRVGDGENQPGAELNAYWYMRNAKMFAKLDMIAHPGDRILLIVGSGHATWMRHFIQRMPGYELVDPLPYLRAATIVDAQAESAAD